VNYLSVCSGIEAASVAWQPLGWKAVGFSEIERFPCSVLKHHYPEVPNFGDMTKYEEWPIKPGSVDVLIGGTPCQSFSVAGLRKGLADPRGNLALVYLALVDRIRPRWVVWENVPGVLSDKTRVVHAMLDALTELGYISDIEILDAQFFGVAQRRRRVFICAQRVEDLLKVTTPSSSLTICQCLSEICLNILNGLSNLSENAQVNLEFHESLRDGLFKRMKLFGLLGETTPIYGMWQSNLAATFRKYQVEREQLAFQNGEFHRDSIPADLYLDLKTVHQSLPTETQWQSLSEEFWNLTKSCITSTSTSRITTNQIFTCFQIVLAIAKLTALLNPSSPRWSGAELSILTSLKEFIKYARSASSDLFGGIQWDDCWNDAVVQAEYLCQVIGHIGDWQRAASVLFERESGTRCHPARGQAREETAADLAPCLTASGRGTERVGESRGQDPLIACMAQGQANAEVSTDGISPVLTCDHEAPIIAHTLTAQYDSSEDGSGRGLPLVAQTITKNNASNVATAGNNCGVVNAIISTFGVRRLTPVECERLQGFPDGYTNIPKSTDGPRYRALGNSMAVPVIRWIGERIQAVDSIPNT